jgi:CHAT domain-containing protein/tetratricopeptide (TPR) repeat protein
LKPMAECPRPEAIAALLDGGLARGEAHRLRAHVADCPDCLEMMTESMHFMSQSVSLAEARVVDSQRFTWSVSKTLPWLTAAAALLLGVSMAVILRSRGADDIQVLVAALGQRRVVEARVTGGFPYAPWPSPQRGPRVLDRANPDDWKVFEAASKIREGALRSPSSASEARALGAAHLVLGNIESAVQALEDASRRFPRDARILSDLSAARIARADLAGAADDLVRAIDAAKHALELDPRLVEASFNLALALEKQWARAGEVAADPGPAIEAWEDYLRRETDPGWAAEAREHLAALRGRRGALPMSPDPAAVEASSLRGDVERASELIRLEPRVGREVLERRLWPAWAEAQQDLRGNEAARFLDASSTLARAVGRVSGDRLGEDVVAAIAKTPLAGDTPAWTARGLLAYRQGLEFHDRSEFEDAGARFRAALDALDRGRNPLRSSAALHLAICDYYAGRASEARRELDRLADEMAGRRYPSLLGRVRWMQGLLHAVDGDLSRSLELYQDALSLFRGTHELDAAASAHFLIAENLDFLGDQDAAWVHRSTALALASRVPAVQRRSIHLDAALAALDQGMPWAALAFHEPLMDAWNTADPMARCETLETRARIMEDTGNTQAALADVTSASEALAGVSDPGLRRRLAAELAERKGGVLAAREPGDAIRDLQDASAYFTSVGTTSRVPQIDLLLGSAHEALASFREAEAAYARGIDALERSNAQILLEPHRISFLDRTWKLYDSMIGLEAGRLDRPDRAFAFAERERRSDLLAPGACGADAGAEGGDGIDGDAHRLGEIARDIPGDTALIYLVLVPGRLLRWVVRTGSVEYRPQIVADDEVEAFVRDVQRAAATDDEGAFRVASADLYDRLLRPVEELLGGLKEIRFVPDRRLNDVPFAALLERDSGLYLVERFATGVAPSAFALTARCGASRRSGGGRPRALVVGNPGFDGARHPGLARLPDAETEARNVAALYADSVLLTNASATTGRFRSEMAEADIIHYAGHAIVNERYPLLSALLLAPDPESGDEGLLTTLELQRATMGRARLVVLGACHAAGGGSARPGGEFNLSRPFLAAGVPEIVGTLWDVRDREAGAILVRFHREIGRGVTAVRGLREAQLAMLHGQEPAARSVLSWGAFVVNGTTLR